MATLGSTCPYYGGVQVPNPANVIYPTSAPSSNLKVKLGTMAVINSTGTLYVAVSLVGGVTTWALVGGGSSEVNTLTGDSGGAISPTGGNITLAGTANQITTTGSGSTITASLIGPYTPATYTSHGVLVGAGTSSIVALAVGATGTVLAGSTGANPAFTGSPSVSGSLTAATTITATLGNITATNGNLVLGSAGNKLVIHASTALSDSVGTTVAMSGTPGTITVSTTACTASSKVFVQRNTVGGTLGNISVPAATIGAGSFVINSDANETSTFSYLIIN